MHCMIIVSFHSFFPDSLQGEYQRKLYKELMENYNRLERPVLNDSSPIVVELGLTLLQIIDVVSIFYTLSLYYTMYDTSSARFFYIKLNTGEARLGSVAGLMEGQVFYNSSII